MAQPTHQNALPIGSMLMEYRLESVLGAGGFGITYLAFDTNLEKQVAIKEYLPTSVAVRSGTTVLPTSPGQEHDYKWGLERFIQESRTLARFTHPHIVRVNRFFESNGTGYMVMDYEDGEPLKAYLQRHPFPSEGALKSLLAPLLDGLEKVHAAGFLHRDIKPDNIFVRKDGGAVLIDFGSARQAVGGTVQALTTIVSPGYAPFEQYTTSAEQGPWSDIYALAGVLYFAVTGQSPPDAITRMKTDTLAQGLGAARMRYSTPLVDAIGWGLALEEANRPRTIGQWRDALLGQRSVKPQPAPAAPPATPQPAVRTGAQPIAGAARPSQVDQVQRAAAIATAMAESRRERRSEPSPWRWIFAAALALSIAIVGSRMMSNRQQKTVIQTAPVLLVAPHRLTLPPAPRVQEAPPPAGPVQQPASGANEIPGAAADPHSSPQQAVTETVLPATAVQSEPAASQPVATHIPPRLEQRIESRMQAADADGLGFTREQFAQTFPRLSQHFEEIDADHDGHVTAQELMVGWQRFGLRNIQESQ